MCLQRGTQIWAKSQRCPLLPSTSSTSSATMSARQRFIAQSQPGGNAENEPNGGGEGGSQPQSSGSECIQSAAATDVVASTTNNKVQPGRPPEPLGITTQPLNIASLTRPKKGENGPKQTSKKPRNSSVDKIKNTESAAISRLRSPKPTSMSPSRIPTASASASPFAFNNNRSATAPHKDSTPSGLQLAPSPFRTNRPDAPVRNDARQMSAHSPQRPRNSHQYPSSYQARQQTNSAAQAPVVDLTGLTGDRNTSRNQDYSAEQIFDFEVPTEAPGTALLQVPAGVAPQLDQSSMHHPLRRTTKRIGNPDEDEQDMDVHHARKRPRQDEHLMNGVGFGCIHSCWSLTAIV